MRQSCIKALYKLERELKGDGYEVGMRINLLRRTLIMVISLNDKDIEQLTDIGRVDTPTK